jgi:hypothetical protein
MADQAIGCRLRSAAQERAFAYHARRFGQDAERLRGDGELVSYPIVGSVADVRALSAATAEQRRRRQRVFFNPAIEARRRIGQGVHDRLEAAAFADGQIDAVDAARAAAHMPFPTRVLSVRHRDVRPGESWDLSVRGDHWGLDDRDDIISVVNVGSLRLQPGATVVVRGNVLVLVIQRLICEGGESNVPGQLAIGPTPFSVDFNAGPFDGNNGRAGRDGIDGADGEGAPTAPTWIGARLLGPVVPGAADGRDGGDATVGGPGAKGRTGGAAKLAEITIAELTGSLTILATAGSGGHGGDGGPGGRGGDGGDGAPGQRTLRGVLPPGRGGDGGDGADGGRGGSGGGGGIASNVFVSLPPEQAAGVRVLAHPAGGGRGGSGGRGGAAGRPGRGGAHPPEPGAAGTGRPGIAGADGPPGRDGRMRPAPPVFVNERAVEPMPFPSEFPTTAMPTTGGERR